MGRTIIKIAAALTFVVSVAACTQYGNSAASNKPSSNAVATGASNVPALDGAVAANVPDAPLDVTGTLEKLTVAY